MSNKKKITGVQERRFRTAKADALARLRSMSNVAEDEEPVSETYTESKRSKSRHLSPSLMPSSQPSRSRSTTPSSFEPPESSRSNSRRSNMSYTRTFTTNSRAPSNIGSAARGSAARVRLKQVIKGNGRRNGPNSQEHAKESPSDKTQLAISQVGILPLPLVKANVLALLALQ